MAQLSPLVTTIIFLVIFIGLSIYVRKAFQLRPKSWSFDYFFLGGQNIGAETTKHTNWGLTFAWSNGIWFFAFLSYQYGPVVILAQIPWCLSICLVAYLFRHILKAAKNNTIHGYIGKLYGDNSRKVACVATTIGYVLNCGFEIFMSSMIFCITIGKGELTYIVAVVISIIFGSYCMIGGYVANCRTDKSQAISGMIAVTALCLFSAYTLKSIPGLTLAAAAVTIVCVLYSLSGFYETTKYYYNKYRLQDLLNVISIAVLIIIVVIISQHQETVNTLKGGSIKIFESSSPPIMLIVGLSVFQLFFSLIDMANWQTISANSDVSPKDFKDVRLAFVRSAIYLMWFPAFSGIVLGCAMRVFPDLVDQTIFPAVFTTVMPSAPELIKGGLFGLIFLGLFSTSLSSADSYLMAAINTLSWDLFYHTKYKEIIQIDDKVLRLKAEAEYVEKVRNKLIPLAIFMTVVFGVCFYIYKDILALQFIMYGSALSLFPCVMYGLYLQNKNRTPIKELEKWALASIALGVISALIPYFAYKAVSDSDISTISPILSLLGSCLVFVVGLFVNKKNLTA